MNLFEELTLKLKLITLASQVSGVFKIISATLTHFEIINLFCSNLSYKIVYFCFNSTTSFSLSIYKL